MRKLFLVRHAKSSWSDPAIPDEKRPLDARGKRDAPRMGKRLAKRDVKPDLMVSSPAKRALATARAMARKLGYKRKDIRVDKRLYATSPDDLLRVIRKLGDRKKSVMLFGHNPELAELVHRLSGKTARMPTCAVAELHLDAKSWASAGKRKPERVVLHTPKGK